MIIKIKIKQVYGQERIYIVEPAAVAHAVASLTGQKSLTRSNIAALKGLGMTFEVQTETV